MPKIRITDGPLAGKLRVTAGDVGKRGPLAVMDTVQAVYRDMPSKVRHPVLLSQAHTSAEATSGVVTQSSIYATGHGWRAFAQQSNLGASDTPYSYWHSSLTGPHWIAYDFGGQKLLTSYSVKAAAFTTAGQPHAPKQWNLQGSDDGTNWTTLQVVSGQLSWTALEERTFVVSAPQAYRHYRLADIVAIQNSYVHIDEIKFFGLSSGVSYAYGMLSLATFTSGTNNGHAVTNVAGTEFVATPAWKAFNGVKTYYDGQYQAAGWSTTFGQFIYQFPHAVIPTQVKLWHDNSSTTSHVDRMTLEGSTDGVTWQTILNNVSVANDSVVTIPVSTGTPVNRLRVRLDNDTAADNTVNCIAQEIEFWGFAPLSP